MAQDHVAGLILLANLFTATDVAMRVDEPAPEKWIDGVGFRYVPLNETTFAAGLRRGVIELNVELEKFVNEVDINLVEITGKLWPHHHERSDVVLKCVGQDRRSSIAFCEAAGSPVWHPVRLNDLFVLSRGTVHGFEQVEGRGRTFRLVDLSYPPLEDEDIVYRE